MNLMDKSLQDIKDGKYALVVLNNSGDEVLFTSNETGVKSLLKLVHENKEILKNSCVFDKVIGSAAAFLMAYAEVDICYGLTMSVRASDIFEGNEIKYSYVDEVPAIMKNENEMCLMEQLVKNAKTNEEAYEKLYEFFKDKI